MLDEAQQSLSLKHNKYKCNPFSYIYAWHLIDNKLLSIPVRLAQLSLKLFGTASSRLDLKGRNQKGINLYLLNGVNERCRSQHHAPAQHFQVFLKSQDDDYATKVIHIHLTVSDGVNIKFTSSQSSLSHKIVVAKIMVQFVILKLLVRHPKVFKQLQITAFGSSTRCHFLTVNYCCRHIAVITLGQIVF